ncbi:cell division protein FtsQ [Mucilaginibacter mali]|uniref:Cell division protein FtsQ n=1 Tax=Mucilaginibacter mali TaxID=2740462 RepID=A0A7D4PS60_9SPHI|nr:cell division protein FtsQ [Mucilaginibacter mali]QKJ28768.1 cell division protein FtsQ [Mucilaginibacter mali]
MFKNKRLWRNILFGFIWLVSLSGLVVLMSFIEVKKSATVCKDVQIIIPGNQFFIDKQEVDNILGLNGTSLKGLRISNINIQALENKLRKNPFVESATVYVDMDGVLMVEISQRQPMLRIVNRYDRDFYVDQHGLKIPLSDNFTAKVLVANGYIDEGFANRVDTLMTPMARNLFKTADFIRRDSLWSAQIAQLYVNEKQEIELIPRVGNQRILLGNADSLEVKFRNLLAFYKQAIPQVGWVAYKAINIKYTNQVIGIKNDNLKHDTAAVNNAVKPDSLLKAAVDTTKKATTTTTSTNKVKN